MGVLLNPQVTPSDHAYSILQDHGPDDGGWGPAAVRVVPAFMQPTPFIYTGSEGTTLEHLRLLAEKLALETGKPTRLVRYSVREDIACFGEEQP